MKEFRMALDLATEEELQALTQLLFQPRFNPLDYFQTPHPIDVQSRSRRDWSHALEERFFYLAADGVTVLRGQSHTLSYRDVLLQICQYLHVSYSETAETTEIETDIFLHLFGQAWKRLPSRDRVTLNRRIQNALTKTDFPKPLPLTVQRDPMRWLLGSGAIAVSSAIQPVVLNQIARQFAIHFAKQQLAKEAMKGSAAAATKFQGFIAMQMARRGMAVNTARYATTRSVFAALGPILWTWLLADIGWRAISTNYGRIIPAVFAVAQIRLTREEAWQYAS